MKKKSSLQKRKDNPNSTYWGRKALTAWAELCRVKYNSQCAICGATVRTEAHHIISKKTCKALMYHPENQILLCTHHHNFYGTEQYRFSAHKHPLAFYHYLQKYYPTVYAQILSIDISAMKKKNTTTKEYYEILLKQKILIKQK